MDLYILLLLVHIAAGAITLFSALVAILSKMNGWAHRVHAISGQWFSGAMLVIFLTSLPMSLLRFNLFLLLVSVFSFYLMTSGWYYATDRNAARLHVLRIASGAMLAISAAMLVAGALQLLTGGVRGAVLIVFGAIGALLARTDWSIAKNGGVRGQTRIGQHLTMMIAATIAAVTAFSVNVVQLPGILEPVMWLLPTAVLAPVIVMQRRKLSARPVSEPRASTSQPL
jgi:hypothetical protein